LLPETTPFGLEIAVKNVFWSGALVLAAYLLVARARFLFSLQMTMAWAVQGVATLVQTDPHYKDRLAYAQSNPGPYMELVSRYLDEERGDNTPSLLAYLYTHLGLSPSSQNLSADKQRRPIQEFFTNLRRFGQDKTSNHDYNDPLWLARYAGWRLVCAFDMIGSLLKAILTTFGLWKP
jgi:hypothetical protein